MSEPAEYPPERGEKIRWLPFPVRRPGRRPEKAEEKPRRSGDPHCPACRKNRPCAEHVNFTTSYRAGLPGLPARGGGDDDMGVRDWAPWPPP